jgi:hypothetical protein
VISCTASRCRSSAWAWWSAPSRRATAHVHGRPGRAARHRAEVAA